MQQTRRQFLKTLIQGVASVATLSFTLPVSAANFEVNFNSFMRFSKILTAEDELNPKFGALCWRYVQEHAQPPHFKAMLDFLHEKPSLREEMLKNNSDLKSIVHHTLSVWYKGNLTSITHTKEEAKLAYLSALQWKAIGIPARGECVGNWGVRNWS